MDCLLAQCLRRFLVEFLRLMSTPRLHFSSFLRVAGPACALLALGGLGGCGEEDTGLSAFAPACPHFDVPGSIADRFVYNGKGLDIGNQISHTQILAVNGDCSDGPKDAQHRPLTRVRLSLALQQERGPAATHTSEDVPYFVAVVQDGKIIDKKTFTDTVRIPPSRDTQRLNTPLRFIDIPTGKNPQVSPYSMEIGFQLTRDELNYNRQHLKNVANFESHVQ